MFHFCFDGVYIWNDSLFAANDRGKGVYCSFGRFIAPE